MEEASVTIKQMKLTRLLVVALILAWAGFTDAGYLSYAALSGKPLSCTIAFFNQCNEVTGSAYAHLFGVPLALFGAGFYATLFLLVALALALRGRRMSVLLLAFAIIGALMSSTLMSIQFIVLRALCLYCTISALISFSLLITVWRLYRHTRPLPPATPFLPV